MTDKRLQVQVADLMADYKQAIKLFKQGRKDACKQMVIDTNECRELHKIWDDRFLDAQGEIRGMAYAEMCMMAFEANIYAGAT